MATQPKKILVLIDGSERSMQTIRYLGKCLPPDGLHVVLFHVFDPVPECYWDLESIPPEMYMIRGAESWEQKKKEKIDAFMETARNELLACGYDETSVEIKVRNRKHGITRDIVKEASKGYGAVMLRRRGFSLLENIFIGSVAGKLLSNLLSIPLIICGQISPAKKILLAIDGSDSSYRVVEMVGKYLGADGYEVELYHVIRGIDSWPPTLPDAMIPNDRFEMARTEMTALFDELKKMLADAGMDPGKISEKIVTGEFSRAGAIVREATEGGFGTIVVGRRGISKIEEFFMGRVSNKVIHAGRNHTVWVV